MKKIFLFCIVPVIIGVVTLTFVSDIGVEGFNRPSLPDHKLHYNYGVIKDVDGIWYKTTYFCFEDDSQSISVYYGSDLFDFVMANIHEGDFVIVVWKWVNTRAETFDGYITVPWLERLVKNDMVVFPLTCR